MIEQAFVMRRADAIRGSENLRDAILTAKGHPIPARNTRVRSRAKPRTSRAKPRNLKAIPAPHPPSCCEHCGAPTKPMGLLISHIQAVVASYYGLPLGAMVSQRRAQEMSHPRQIAMYLSSELTPKSLPAIGQRFGGRDHTTVIHAIKAVKARIVSDLEIELDVSVLRERLAA